ncbi:MAG TPA: nitroreductase [Aliidongia sp.]|nr:nitroreductase [Aliidongia sp.]
MKVSDAIMTRISTRAFLDRPVPEATVRAILETARYAPSGGNLQPWHVYVLAGERLAQFRRLIEERRAASPLGEGTEYDVYPRELGQPYKARRNKCGEDLYATIGIARENRTGRLAQFARNFRLFDAPVALFFAIDRQMGPGQWADLGMFIQSVMLLAREHGLHSCAQEAWALWHKSVAEFTRMPEELMLFCGMGLGYMDETAPINRLRTERAPLEEFAHFEGF